MGIAVSLPNHAVVPPPHCLSRQQFGDQVITSAWNALIDKRYAAELLLAIDSARIPLFDQANARLRPAPCIRSAVSALPMRARQIQHRVPTATPPITA